MATLNVGAGQAYATLSAAVAASRDGDVINVQAGTYVNDFATISTDITIVGVGGMANFVATVAPPNGKGILVTQSDVTIQNLSFSGAAVADMNGAGIRYEGGNLIIIDSYFHDNQDGLLSNADPNGTIRIVGSEFANNGAGDGFSHNLYVGNIASLVIDDSYFHDASVGHQIKSRAQSTTITNSRIYDGTGTASYSIDIPNGGVTVIKNNVIEQGPNSQNPIIIDYGLEGSVYAGSSLLIEGNTVVNDMSGSSVRLLFNATTVTGTVSDNAVYGLTANQVASGPSTVSGTTFLSARPALDSGGGGGGGGGSDGGSAAVGQVTGLSQDTGIPGDFKTNVANQMVSGTYTGALAAGDVIQVSADGSTWIGATAGAGTWTAGVTLLPGEHTLAVRTVDDVGNIVNGTGHAYDLDLTGSVAIESSGATRLDQVADQFFLRDSGGFDSSLKYQGNAVTAGQFGAWTPIGAEKTAGGYQVAWKFGSADQYIVWNLDSNGNYASNATGVVSGSDPELQNLETVFQQDLNADGTTGPNSVTLIESSGATRLDQVADQFFLHDSGGFDSSLKYQGNAVTAGQFGAWTPIGAEKTAGGYQVAWKFGSADQYIVWNLDSNGNYSNDGGAVSGSSPVLQSLEPAFHQDLNGDGTIGVVATLIESSGSTRLLASPVDNGSTAVNTESPAANQANAAATPQSSGSPGDSGVLLLTNYMASTFAPTGGESTGGLPVAEALHEQLLAKPAV